MKNHRWLSVAEYIMLAGSGAGAVATAASQQVLYAAAPLSALVVLNVLNHRRLELVTQQTTEVAVSQLDQKLSNTLSTLQQQVQALPSPLHLASLRKDLQTRNQNAFNELTQRVQQVQQDAAQAEWHSLPEEMAQLREQYLTLAHSIAGVKESLSRLNTVNRTENVETELGQLRTELSHLRSNLQTVGSDQKLNQYRALQDQINHINRRLNKLPAPFDATALRQDVEALIRAVGDAVPRRDLARLEARLQDLAEQNDEIEQTIVPVRVVTNILRKQVDTVSTRLNVFEEMFNPTSTRLAAIQPDVIGTLEATVNTLEHRVNQLPDSSDLTNLRAELQGLVSNHLGQLQQQFTAVQQHTQELDQQQRSLRDWVQRLPQLLDSSALQHEVKYLTTRVEWAENTLSELQTQVTTPPVYELVFDLEQGDRRREGAGEAATRRRGDDSTLAAPLFTSTASRTLLEQALDQVEARLIVVYPFPDPVVLDEEMIERFRQFLERKGCLDVGWGHLGAGEDHNSRSIDRRRTINPTDNPFLFNRLNQLTELKKQYPDQFRFKVLGTEEQFLVCDRAYAILGTQSLATTSVAFPEATVGLRTTDTEIIQALVERFEQPTLNGDDATAYFNRAATRYELGDRQGAIADYTEVLAVQPDDAALNNRGLVRYDLGDRDGAIADFDTALQHNPQNFTAQTNRGYVRSELGDKLGAIEDYSFALQLNPDYATAYFYRGLARTRMQNKLGAIQDYTEVIRLNPQAASAYFYRGLASAKIGQRLEALRDLRQAAQLFATQGDAQNYQQTVAAIKKLHKTLAIGEAAKPLVSSEA